MNQTIREASIEDIPNLVCMGEKFHAMSPHKVMGSYDKKGIANTIKFMIDSESCLILTNGNGVIGGVIAPLYFHPAKLVMEESFWWANNGGMDLLKEFIKKSANLGVDFVSLSTLENKHKAAIKRALKPIGFRPLEQRFIMEI